ncbi:MAG: 4Fe-4S dicluster domain-containing protein [Planctomycetaceae bacterium]
MTSCQPATFVRRPQRWDNPLDASMSDADVAWLRSRQPFSSLDPAVFPKSTPLDGILRHDCRLLRCEPGEIVVREGDYGNSAFLLLAGSVRVLVSPLAPEYLGREREDKLSWAAAVRQWWSQSKHAEVRTVDQVVVSGGTSVGSVDNRPALFLQDYAAILADRQTVKLGPGELFGEVAAMYRTPCAATVIVEEEATLVEIRWQGLKLLRRDPTFAQQLESHYRQHWLRLHLRELPLLRHLPEDCLDRVASATQMQSFGRTEWNADFRRTQKLSPREQIESEPIVAQENSFPTSLIVIRSGFARTSRQHGSGHQTTAYLGSGNLFGLSEIVHACFRSQAEPAMVLQQTLRAVGFVDTLHIPIEVFAADVLPHVRRSELPADVRHLADRHGGSAGDRRRGSRGAPAETRRRGDDHQDIASSTGSRSDHTGRLEFLVEHRLFNGKQAMVIDLHRCTRCDDCVKACASTHDGNPRFVRDGLVHERLQFVQACMQCSDPICMIGCPTGAIHRDTETGLIQIQESICIGCGVCAASCPYENIRMTPINDRQGRPYRDAKSGMPIVKATKCDMCRNQPAGPACVSACPHDALTRIDLTQSEPLQYWLDKR